MLWSDINFKTKKLFIQNLHLFWFIFYCWYLCIFLFECWIPLKSISNKPNFRLKKLKNLFHFSEGYEPLPFLRRVQTPSISKKGTNPFISLVLFIFSFQPRSFYFHLPRFIFSFQPRSIASSQKRLNYMWRKRIEFWLHKIPQSCHFKHPYVRRKKKR